MKATGWVARVEFLVGIKLSSSPPHLVTSKTHLSSNQVGTMATSWANNTTKISITAYFLVATQFRIFSCTCTHFYLSMWQNATAQEKLTGLEKITKIMSLCYLAFQFVDFWKIKIRQRCTLCSSLLRFTKQLYFSQK